MPARPPLHRAPGERERRAWESQPKRGQVERIRGRKGVQLRERVKREEPLCRMCSAKGLTRITEEVDHIVPLKQGGTNDRSNLQGLCSDCHHEKTQQEAQHGRGAG